MAAMEGVTDFERVFPSSLKFPYDRTLQHEIEHHRKAVGGTLFIDRVMTTLGLVKGRTYPPKSENALRQLHQLFCDSNMSVQHKQSLIYYILLDFDTESSQSSTSDTFAADAGMPVNYQIFMRGLWLMDRQQFKEALKFVAHPSLKPDFADEIIITLVHRL
ncbi:ELYS-domaining containing protein [Ophiocordyceps camponoti-floridani]|uniref:ELYS-domaining containing protein n=1 Tax=Ophiocordyceps camponoti-floridani TaxID=2030778 RepID=A0A8H4VF55_9HYPO|nr:ELYS-domaining containing protein [Ophiocordyceps camponoti-floridani]